MAGGLAERKKPEHIHNPSGPQAFLLRPHYKEPSGSAGMGPGYARGRVAVRTGLPLERERAGTVRSKASGSAGMGPRYARGRVAVRARLPLGRERAGMVRSGPSGSEGMGPGYAQRRVAVQPTLPLGRERTSRNVQRRVAVQDRGLGTLGAEWQCGRDCHSDVNVLVGTFRGEWQCYIHRSYWFSSPSTSCLKNVRFLLKFSVSARIFFPRAFAIALMTASKL